MFTENASATDRGPAPFVVNLDRAARQNRTFRTALWTGKHLQLTLMSIPVKGEIGKEIHTNLDQFLRVEDGYGLLTMGRTEDMTDTQARLNNEMAFLIPAGTWHNVRNTGSRPLKLSSVYAPPQHPHGTVHATKAEADAAEAH